MLTFLKNNFGFEFEEGVLNFAANSYANNLTPYFFFTKVGSSTISKFEAVLVDTSGIELSRTTLNTAFILVNESLSLFYCLNSNTISLCANSLYYFYIETLTDYYTSNVFLTFEPVVYTTVTDVSRGGALAVQKNGRFNKDVSLANFATKALEYTTSATFAFQGEAVETVTNFSAFNIDSMHNVLSETALDTGYLSKDSNSTWTVSSNILPVPLCLNTLYFYKIITTAATYYSEIFLSADLLQYSTQYLILADDVYYIEDGNGNILEYK